MKKKYYLTLDTETATLPFADTICKTAKEKQTISIAKPLVYDIGWVITDRQGNVVLTENYLVQETFFVPNVFNTAYYKDKRPIYIELLERGKIKSANWNYIMFILYEHLCRCDLATAYNACFDFKKAIPFTERYIDHLYSKNYSDWEEKQKKKCKKILEGGHNEKNPKYLEPIFYLRGAEFPIADLWGISCKRLINNSRYKNYCLENGLLSESAQYFKTSAETSFQYLMKDHSFVEDHTALSDALIEAEILAKALKKGKVEPEIESFPFRELGTTIKYVETKKGKKYKNVIRDALETYILANDGESKALDGNKYWKRVIKYYCDLDLDVDVAKYDMK